MFKVVQRVSLIPLLVSSVWSSSAVGLPVALSHRGMMLNESSLESTTPLHQAIAQSVTPSDLLPLLGRQPHRPRLRLGMLLQLLRRSRPARPVTRSGGVCLMSPGLVGELQIWSDRPLFLWKGTGNQLSVRDHATQTVLWTQPISATDQWVVYAGPPLQPGNHYQWQLLDATPSESDRNQWITFEVMSLAQRDQIASELQALEQELQASGASEEAIAYEKAYYFGERQLWSDALQVTYAIDSPSSELIEERQSMLAEICP